MADTIHLGERQKGNLPSRFCTTDFQPVESKTRRAGSSSYRRFSICLAPQLLSFRPIQVAVQEVIGLHSIDLVWADEEFDLRSFADAELVIVTLHF